MAEITKVGRPTLSTVQPPVNSRLSGLEAGETIEAADAVYIKNVAGKRKIFRCIGTSAAAAKCRGFAAEKAFAGEGVTLLRNLNIGYGANLVPGTSYYISGTVPGGLADAPSTNGTVEVAFAYDETRIHVHCGGN